jgi:MoaA/NifB/PqqE/SkfB family radical SAM enzyme
MVRYAESRGVSTNLTANGTLIRKHLNEIFRSGLREIAFGVYDEGLFRKVLPQIEEFVAEKRKRRSKGPKTYLDITIYQGNADQIPEMVRLAGEIGIDALILHRLFNIYGVDPGGKCLSEADEEELLREVRQVARAMKLELYLPPKHSWPCRIVKHSIFVTVDGKVTPCTYLPALYLGDALNEGVARVMHSEAYREFVKNMKQHHICSKCRW